MANDLTPERWQKIKELFHEALELEANGRAAFLDEVCAGDDDLRREIESLLAAHNEPDNFIDKAAFEVAAELLATGEVPSAIGHIIGPYKIIGQIGRGGMGEVYLAQDTRLGRRVALKMLPSRYTSDSDRLRRFKQEARAASALNHPNIITIHEVGQVNAAHFIATEFVEGRTLRSSIEEGAIKHAEAIDVAIQVASALGAAHEAGIVHRDIKPENIMLRPDGYVKVLDFGLAKLVERSAMITDTGSSFTAVDTNPGIVMGTASYMSPEQARGLAMDARTDVFSLGVVLYEMVAGRVPFDGETVSDIIVAILEKQPPPLSATGSGAPGELQAIIDKALQKKKEERYQTAREMLDDLRKLKQDLEIRARIESGSAEELLVGVRTGASGEQASATPVAAITAANPAHVTGRIKLRKRAALVIPAVAVVVLAAVAVWINWPVEQSRPETPFQPMELVRVNTVRKALDAAISPDGKYVAYVTSEANRQTIWLKQLATNTDTQIVPPAEMSFRWVAFSPEGNYLYYIANRINEPRALYQMPAMGGPARKLAVQVTTPFSFSPDGKQLAFVRRSNDGETAIIIANVEGNYERKLASRKLPGLFTYRGPSWSPDGGVIVCGAGDAPFGINMTLVEVRVEDGAVRPITSRQWSPIHKVCWLRDGSGLVLLAVDKTSWDFPQVWFLSYPGGEARRITTDLNKYGQYNLSLAADSSAILTLKSDTVSNIWIVPDGASSRAKQITFGPAGRNDGLYGLSWTPDGKLVYGSFVSNREAIFIMNEDGTDPRQLTPGDYTATVLSTTRDGRHVVFHSTRAGTFNIWGIDIDGNNLRQVTNGTGDTHPYPSPDGKWVFYASSYEGKPSLYKAPIDGGQPIRLFDQDSAFPAVSPDGKLVAFPYFDEQLNTRRMAVITSETGQLLKTFDIGYYWNFVRWTPDGRAVAYIKTEGDVSNIWAQPIDGGRPVQLTDFKSDIIFNFVWSNDGKHLAVARGSETSDVVLIRDVK